MNYAEQKKYLQGNDRVYGCLAILYRGRGLVLVFFLHIKPCNNITCITSLKLSRIIEQLQ